MIKSHGFVNMTKKMFYLFFKRAWKALLTKANIKSAYKITGIWPYNLEKTLLICAKKLSSIPAKRFYIKFALKILLSNHAIYQLAKKSYLNTKNCYIQIMLIESK